MPSLPYFSRLLTYLLLLFPLLTAPAWGQQVTLDCLDDESLTSYLLDLIDTLYANGLTIFEQLIADASETDTGYSLLLEWYSSSSTLTILPPADAAFQAAGLNPPFTSWAETDLANLLALHVLNGSWGYDSLPQSPLHGTAYTQLLVNAEMGVNTTSDQAQVLVLVQGGDGQAVVVDQINGNATSWDGPMDLSSSGISNLVVLPIDTVLTLPSNLSVALSTPTTSRSASGLNNLTAALSTLSGGVASLEAFPTDGGFTIFAPVDDAWNTDVSGTVAANSSVLGNMYSTSQSIYSSWWGSSSGTYTMESGISINVTWNEAVQTHYVSFTSGTSTVLATILRADVPLENGVMHIIDTVLVQPSDTTTTTAGTTPTTLSKGTTSTTSSNPGQSTGTGGSSSNTGSTDTTTNKTSAGARALSVSIVAVIIPIVVMCFGL